MSEVTRASGDTVAFGVLREALAERFGLLFLAEDDPWLAHRLGLALGGAALDDEGLARQVRATGAAAERVVAAVAPAASAFAGAEPLKSMLPTLTTAVPRHPGEPLVVWSLGCGTGAEGYSALFALADAGCVPSEVRLYGVDLVEPALERARAAAYAPRELAAGLPPAWADAYLEPAEGAGRVRAEWRDAARWVRANLAEPLPAMPRPHAVLCRDVLGWLREEARRQTLTSIAERLADQGALATLAAEAPLIGAPFEPVGEAWPGAFRRAGRGA